MSWDNFFDGVPLEAFLAGITFTAIINLVIGIYIERAVEKIISAFFHFRWREFAYLWWDVTWGLPKVIFGFMRQRLQVRGFSSIEQLFAVGMIVLIYLVIFLVIFFFSILGVKAAWPDPTPTPTPTATYTPQPSLTPTATDTPILTPTPYPPTPTPYLPPPLIPYPTLRIGFSDDQHDALEAATPGDLYSKSAWCDTGPILAPNVNPSNLFAIPRLNVPADPTSSAYINAFDETHYLAQVLVWVPQEWFGPKANAYKWCTFWIICNQIDPNCNEFSVSVMSHECSSQQGCPSYK